MRCVKKIELLILDSDGSGGPDLLHLERVLQEDSEREVARIMMVCITHMPTNGGYVAPARMIGELCKKFDVLYLLDACQTVGQLPIDVQEIGVCTFCDAVMCTLNGDVAVPIFECH